MILVVEDSEISQSLMSAMLDRLGYRHDIVSNGLEAVEFAAANDCALVLMDLNMPIMGGHEAARAIRQLPGEAGSVPIVCMSGSLTGPEQAEIEASGMTAMLSKPFRMTELASIIETHARIAVGSR